MALEIISAPSDLVVQPGNDICLRFKVEADNGSQPEPSWTRNGKALGTCDRFAYSSEKKSQNVTELEVIINSVTNDDEGMYELAVKAPGISQEAKSEPISVRICSDLNEQMMGKSVPKTIPKRMQGINESSTRVARCAPGKTATIMVTLGRGFKS